MPNKTPENPTSMPQEEFLKILAQEEVTVVEAPREYATPKNIDYSGFGELSENPRFKKDIDDVVETLSQYLSGGIYADKRIHAERRDWRTRTEKVSGFSKWYEANRLRGNRIYFYVYSGVDLLIDDLDKKGVTTDRALQIRTLRAQLPDVTAYRTLNNEQCVEFVRAVSAIAEQYITLFTRKDAV